MKWKSQTLTLQYQGEILWGLPISRKHILAHLGTKKQQIIPKARDTKPGFVRLYYYRKAQQESSYGFNRGIPGEIKGMETKKQQCGSHKPDCPNSSRPFGIFDSRSVKTQSHSNFNFLSQKMSEVLNTGLRNFSDKTGKEYGRQGGTDKNLFSTTPPLPHSTLLPR